MTDSIRIPVSITAMEQVNGIFIQRGMQAHFDLTPELAQQIVLKAAPTWDDLIRLIPAGIYAGKPNPTTGGQERLILNPHGPPAAWFVCPDWTCNTCKATIPGGMYHDCKPVPGAELDECRVALSKAEAMVQHNLEAAQRAEAERDELKVKLAAIEAERDALLWSAESSEETRQKEAERDQLKADLAAMSERAYAEYKGRQDSDAMAHDYSKRLDEVLAERDQARAELAEAVELLRVFIAFGPPKEGSAGYHAAWAHLSEFLAKQEKP